MPVSGSRTSMPFLSMTFQRRSATSTAAWSWSRIERIFVEQRQEILGPGLGADADHQRQLGETAAPAIGPDHGAVVGDHLDLAVALPEREGVALGHRDMQPARIELEHGGFGDPGIGLEPRPRLAGVEEQQRGPPGDAGGFENVVARQPALAGERDRGDAEARQHWRATSRKSRSSLMITGRCPPRTVP